MIGKGTLTRLVAAALLLVLGPVAIPAQQPGKIPRVGVLRPGDPPPEDFGQRQALEAGLRDLGWTPGTDILIEYRYAQGKDERLSELAAELVRLPVDVIVASALRASGRHSRRPARSPS
jgi:putative ABC transport system substrate-binding protein